MEDVKEEQIRQLEDKIQQLETIISLLPGHVYWSNRQNIFMGCNDQQARDAKLATRDDIVGKRNQDMLWKDQADSLDAINERVMETGRPHIVEEMAEMANGMGVYLSQKVPLRNRQGNIIG